MAGDENTEQFVGAAGFVVGRNCCGAAFGHHASCKNRKRLQDSPAGQHTEKPGCSNGLCQSASKHHITCHRYRAEPKPPWVPIRFEADRDQPNGFYWITFVQNDKHNVALEFLVGDERLASNAVAFIRIEQPEPWVYKSISSG